MLGLATVVVAASAPPPQLLKNIHTGTNWTGSEPSQITVAGGTTFFVATTTEHGAELWTTDGSADGTRLVKDISPGPVGSAPSQLRAVGGQVYFLANDRPIGNGLWRSDGTEAGTVEVLAADVSDGVLMTGFQGGIIFSGRVWQERGTFWSKGTAETTVRLMELQATQAVVAGTKLFLSYNRDLWTSDGTAAATKQLKQLDWEFPPKPLRLAAVVGDSVYFNASDGQHGDELWKSDGTLVGTVLVKDIVPGGMGSSPEFLTPMNGQLYFTAHTSATGREIWRSNGTEAGTQMLGEIAAGASGVNIPEALTAAGTHLYFTVRPSAEVGAQQLWRTDGTPGLLEKVKDLGAGKPWAYISALTVSSGRLYFAGSVWDQGEELWTTDGTPESTVALTENGNQSDPFDHYVGALAATSNGKVMFAGRDSNTYAELWQSDGTQGGTGLVRNLSTADNHSFPAYFFGSNGAIFFSASDAEHGLELWRSDGTTDGTRLIKDIWLGQGGATPIVLGEMGGMVFFAATHIDSGRELWRTDGTAEGTTLVADIRSGPFSGLVSAGPMPAVAFNGHFYFAAAADAQGFDLWRTDGTAEGTTLVRDFNSESPPDSYQVLNDVLYLTAANGLFRTDGTTVGTVRVRADLSNVRNLARVGDRLMFAALEPSVSGDGPPAVWKSDGTDAGTVIVRRFEAPAAGLNDAGFTFTFGWQVQDGTAFFGVRRKSTSEWPLYDLWRSDGSAAGTVAVATGLSTLQDFQLHQGDLYFTGRSDNSLVTRLWCMKGAAEPPVLLHSGDAGGWPQLLRSDTRSLFFVTSTFDQMSAQLWKTSSSPGTTVKVPALMSLIPNNLPDLRAARVESKLFVGVAAGTEGFEPHVIDLRGMLTVQEVTADAGTLPLPHLSTLQWARRGVSSGASKTVRLLNLGDDDLTGLSASIVAGDTMDFQITTAGAATLAGGTSRDIQVSFTPTAAGVRTAVLRIQCADAAAYDVDLTGTGVVPGAPELVNGPASQIALRGQKIAFSAEVIAAPVVSKVWRRGALFVGRETVLNIPSAQPANVGVYTFNASNGQGAAVTTEPARLAVVTSAPPTVQAPEWSRLTLKCVAHAPAGVKLGYQWLADGKPLPNLGRVSGATTSTLTINPAARQHSAVYECRVFMAGAEPISHGATAVTILPKPEFRTEELPPKFVGEMADIALLADHSPTRWTATGLPPGVTLGVTSGRLTGHIKAVRMVNGSVAPYQVKVTATNASGGATRTLPWLIEPSGLAGGYAALVPRDAGLTNGLGGLLNVTLTGASGTGTLVCGAGTYRFVGPLFTTSSNLAVCGPITLARPASAPPLSLQMTFNPAADPFTATVTLRAGEGPVSTFTAYAQVGGSSPLPWSGTTPWTVFVRPMQKPSDDAYPAGSGYLFITPTSNRSSLWRGKLADGTAITGSSWWLQSMQDDQGHLFMHWQYPKGRGSWQGTISGFDTLYGDLDWFRMAEPVGSANRMYPQGIALHAARAEGYYWQRPTQGMTLLETQPPDYAAKASFSGGALTADWTQTFNLTLQHLAKFPTGAAENPNQVKLTLNPVTGFFSGSFVLKDMHQGPVGVPAVLQRSVRFEGVMAPIMGNRGFFLAPELPASGQPAAAINKSRILSGDVELAPQ